METPTINKKQSRSTLSAKKTKAKGSVKNVVTTPYKNLYWPRISAEDNEMLKVVLENNLPRIKPDKVNVPWKLLKNVPKADRKKFRNEYTKNDQFKINEEDSDGLTFGINDVTKLLEKNLLGVILISGSVQPRIMVRHILDGAVLYGTPIIIYDDLKTLTHNICGIGSAVISINKNINTASKLNLIKESVTNIFEKVGPPEDHINTTRSVQNVEKMDTTEITEENKTDVSTHITDLSDIESVIYLRREPKGKRVFVPPNSREDVNVYKMEVDSSGFLPFTDTPTIETKNEYVKNYKSLIVKRLKGDPNRNKRKIATLKRKLK